MANRPAKGWIIDMRIKLFVGSLVLLVVGFLLGWSVGPRTAGDLKVAPTATTTGANVGADFSPPAEAPKTVSLMLDYGDGTVKTFTDIQLKENETLFDVTKKIVEANIIAFDYDPPGQYGIFVKAIGGLNGGTDGKYWTYWVGNKMGEVAADQYKLKAGDVAEWKFVKLKM